MLVALEEMKRQYQDHGGKLTEGAERLLAMLSDGLNREAYTIDQALAVTALALKEKRVING